MGDDDHSELEGRRSPLRRIIRYLADERTPQRVATVNIVNGFKHNIPNKPEYKSGSVTAVQHLAWALGFLSHTSLYPADDKFSREREPLLRKLYSLEERSDCWKFFCRRDAENFIAEYERLHGSIEPAENAPAGGVPDGARFVPLQWDASAEPKSAQTQYASLALRTGNSPSDPVPGQIHLGFDLHCPEVPTDTLVTSLKRCLLIFDCAGGHTGPLKARTGNSDGEIFDGARVSTFGTSPTEPSWEITAIGAGGIGKVESVPPTFICIDRLKAGSAVKARIRAPVKEIEVTFVLPEGPAAVQSAAKRRIKARLDQLGLHGGEDGDPVLAMSEIVLMGRSGTEAKE